MQQMDKCSSLNTGASAPQEVEIELEDSIVVDASEVSETLRNLDQARAVSIYTKVKMLHPYWKEEDIVAEADLIVKEQGLTPSTFDEVDG